MEAGEYEEALLLAEQYDLDTDQVYQRQWQNNPHSVDSIYSFLVSLFNCYMYIKYSTVYVSIYYCMCIIIKFSLIAY